MKFLQHRGQLYLLPTQPWPCASSSQHKRLHTNKLGVQALSATLQKSCGLQKFINITAYSRWRRQGSCNQGVCIPITDSLCVFNAYSLLSRFVSGWCWVLSSTEEEWASTWWTTRCREAAQNVDPHQPWAFSLHSHCGMDAASHYFLCPLLFGSINILVAFGWDWRYCVHKYWPEDIS